MKLDKAMDYDFYAVEEDDGEKYVHYLGWMWFDSENYDEPRWRNDQPSWCYVPVSEYGSEKLQNEVAICTQYTYDEIDDVDEWTESPTHLPLRDVDESTPCGYYWCLSNEE